MRKLLFTLFTLFTLAAWAHAAGDRPDTMTTHTWMASVWGTAAAAGIAPSPVPPPGNAGDWQKIWSEWGGAAWDTAFHRMEIVGGGHAAYSGNEIQSFKPDSGWARLSTPTDSSKITHNAALYSTGYYTISNVDTTHVDYHAPRARHTYNNVQSIAGKLYMVYCAGCYPDASDASTSDRYNFSLARWDTLGVPYDPGSPTATANGDRGATGVDGHGILWWITGGDNSVISYYSGSKWTTLGSYWDGMATPSSNEACAVVPWQNRMYCFGGGGHGYIKLDTTITSDTLHTYTTSGATGIQSKVAPGVTYDSKDSLILAWAGTDTVYTLSPKDSIWVKIPKANTKAPTSPNAQGTHGRWRYMPEWNAVMVSNAATDSVYYWKPSAGAGTGIGGGGAAATHHMLLTGAGY